MPRGPGGGVRGRGRPSRGRSASPTPVTGVPSCWANRLTRSSSSIQRTARTSGSSRRSGRSPASQAACSCSTCSTLVSRSRSRAGRAGQGVEPALHRREVAQQVGQPVDAGGGDEAGVDEPLQLGPDVQPGRQHCGRTPRRTPGSTPRARRRGCARRSPSRRTSSRELGPHRGAQPLESLGVAGRPAVPREQRVQRRGHPVVEQGGHRAVRVVARRPACSRCPAGPPRPSAARAP